MIAADVATVTPAIRITPVVVPTRVIQVVTHAIAVRQVPAIVAPAAIAVDVVAIVVDVAE